MSAAKTDPLRGMVGGLVCVDLSREPVLQFVDERLTEQMGLPPVGTPLRELILEADWAELCRNIKKQISDKGEVRFSVRILPVPGEEPIRVNCSGRLQGRTLWLAVSPTMAERLRGYDQMVDWYNGFRALLESAPQQAYEWDIEKHTLSEAGFQSTLWRELMMGDPLLEVDEEGIPAADNIYLSDRAAFRQLHRSVLSGGAGGSIDLRMRTGYGVYRWCRLTLATIYGQDGKPRRAVALLVDIDEEKREALMMAKRNERDPLTGLFNGEAARERILTMLKKLQSGYLALYAVDIDHYQQVTDQLGALFGEAVLIGAADKLSTTAGEGAVLARTGVITLVVAKPVPSRRAARALGKLFCEKLRQQFADGKQQLEVTASVGLVLVSPGERDFSALMWQADLALADAKRAGGGQLVTYRHGIPDPGELGETAPTDSVSAPSSAGSFNDNMFYLFFNMLYEGENPDRAIELVLRTAGQHFHVSRAYIYEAEQEDNQMVRLTYEWCAEGVPSRGEFLERFLIPKENVINSREKDIYRCDDVHAFGGLADWMLPRMDQAGVRAFLQSSLLDAGSYRGCIGFDSCADSRIWSDEEQEILRQITRIVGGYLLRTRAMERRSRQDPTTGLPSFSRFRRQVARIRNAAEDGWTLVSFDVVRFGKLSSLFGEQIGSRLLGRIGALIRDRLRSGEIACRVRRDEFALLLRQQQGETAADRAKRFSQALAAPVRALLGHYDLRLACGFCNLQPGERIAATELYRRASLARMRAKRDGMGGYLYYTAEMGASDARRRSIERQAAQALDTGEFKMALRPIFFLSNGKICGMQAHLKWKNAVLGEVDRKEFLPIFERSGFLLTLDLYLIRQVCAVLSKWKKDGIAVPITVRISQLQLTQTNFIDLLTAAVDSAGLDHSLLRLEIPGSGTYWAGEYALLVLQRLRDAGFAISSELMEIHNLLPDLPQQPFFDEMVIPKDLMKRPNSEQLIGGFVTVNHALGVRVRMSDVTDAQEAQIAKEAGCDVAQGDAFSRMVAPRTARTLLLSSQQESGERL